ncbi:MAG: hypothetical protein U1F43_26835 [Myxococcota bacterium]
MAARHRRASPIVVASATLAALVSVALFGLGLASACGEASSERGAGAVCDPLARCDGALLCLDGRCVERPVPPAPPDTETLPPLAHVDVVSSPDGESDALSADDAASDADAPAGEVDGASGETRLVLGPHDALADPSDTKLGLAVGQAAVREVAVPAPAEVAGLEVVAVAPAGAQASACGLYAPVLWRPDGDGGFAVAPSWRAEARPLRASDAVISWAIDGERPTLAPGAVRFGLLYEGPCPDATFAPWLGLDASGDDSDSFVWAASWIPGHALALSGRWGLSLVVALAAGSGG